MEEKKDSSGDGDSRAKDINGLNKTTTKKGEKQGKTTLWDKNIPPNMKEKNQWVLWKLEKKKGAKKPTKIPYTSIGTKAKSDAPATWSSYNTVIDAYVASNDTYSGIGYMFDNEIVGIDIDDCLTSDTIAPDVQDWINRFDSYTELTQSGKGIHILIKGKIPGDRRRKGKFEIYTEKRFFVMTGNLLTSQTQVRESQDVLSEFYDHVFGASSPAIWTDEEIIEKARTAKNGKKFIQLFDGGDVSGYVSHSEADLALCSMVAFYTKNPAQVDRIFRRSGLYSDQERMTKWDKQHGEKTYGKMTIEKAIQDPVNQYSPGYQKNVATVSTQLGQIFEQSNGTFIWREKGRGVEKEQYAFPLCNFTMRFLERVMDDEREITWRVELTKKKDAKKIELSGKELLCINDFRQAIAKHGLFLLNITDVLTFNRFLEFVQKNSSVIDKRTTQYLGRTAQKSFLFCNALAVPGGIEKLTEMIPPKGKLRIYMPQDLHTFWRKLIPIFCSVYQQEAWKILGFNVGSVYSREIVNQYSFFPLIFNNGPSRTGKTTAAEIMSYSFGAQLEIRPHNFSSTVKSWYRQAQKYRGIPIILNEYQPSKKNNATVQALFDRDGYNRAKTDNTLETQRTDVNATFVLNSTRSITGWESEAVVSRLITIDFEKIERTTETKAAVAEIKMQKKYLSSFVSLVLELDINKILTAIEAEIVANEAKMENAESRIVETHSIIKCCANELLINLDLEKYAVSGIQGEIKKQQTTTKDANSAKMFIDILSAMIDKGDINGNIARIHKGYIYFHLNTAYEYVRKFAASSYGQETLPDKNTVAKLLRSLGAQSTNLRILGGSVKKTWNLKHVAP